jgi:hypothetical protein
MTQACLSCQSSELSQGTYLRQAMADLTMGSAFGDSLVLDPRASAFLAWFALGSVAELLAQGGLPCAIA